MLFGSVTLLVAASFLLVMCQKSTAEEEAAGTTARTASVGDAGAADRGDGSDSAGGCTSCSDIEWRIVCPQTCTGKFFDLTVIKFVANRWNTYDDCCNNGQDVWNSMQNQVGQWYDLTYDPVKSSLYAFCNEGFTAKFTVEGYINVPGGQARIPGKVYIQTRRKNDTTNASLRTHFIQVNSDLTGCTPSSTPYPGGLSPVVPITITNGCIVTSGNMISATQIQCVLIGDDGKDTIGVRQQPAGSRF